MVRGVVDGADFGLWSGDGVVFRGRVLGVWNMRVVDMCRLRFLGWVEAVGFVLCWLDYGCIMLY